MAVPENKRVDLLLQFFQRQLMVVPHPEILLDGIIFAGRDINRVISAIAQTLRDQTRIALIRFDSLSLLSEHSCWRKNDTFDSGSCELVLKGIAEAASLVTAFNRIIVIKTELRF